MDQFLQDVFNKAKIESGEKSLRKWAEYLADYLSEEVKYPLSVKTLERYYNADTEPNIEKKNKLAVFLGYKNYLEYLKSQQNDCVDQKKFGRVKTNNREKSNRSLWVLIGATVIVMVAGYVAHILNTGNCMIWIEDHYETTSCEGKAGETKKIPYLLENFRQIEVSDTTTFFKNGKPVVWYDKKEEKLYFFSVPGINPETGKTVKEITEYMIKKYVLTD